MTKEKCKLIYEQGKIGSQMEGIAKWTCSNCDFWKCSGQRPIMKEFLELTHCPNCKLEIEREVSNDR